MWFNRSLPINFIIDLSLVINFVFCQNSQSYDYIVVGSGASGSMVAIQLAKAGFETLLIEAGSDIKTANTTIGIFQVRAMEQDNIRWTYKVQYPGSSTNSSSEGTYGDYPRASLLGGGTQVDNPSILYPSMRDFNRMVQITGDSNWSEENFRRRFKEIYARQSYLDLQKPNGMKFLASTIADGLKLIDYSDMKTIPLATQVTKPSLEYLLNGYDINGYSGNGQLNIDREQTFMMPANIDISKIPYQRRTVVNYLAEPVHPKLHIMTDCLVSKVLIQGNAAIGVEYLPGKHLYRASPLAALQNQAPQPLQILARKEVILSAGAFNSPQLLMLSGIGDPSELARHSIPVMSNVPGVGKNLHQNIEIDTEFRFPSDWKIYSKCTFTGDSSDPCMKEYLKNTGVYTFGGILASNILKSNPKLSEPDLVQFTAFNPYDRYKFPWNMDIYNHKSSYTYITLKADPHNTNGFIALKSSDPRDPPDITLNGFGPTNDDPDIQALIHGIRHARKTAPGKLQGLKEHKPGAHLTTDDQLADYIRNNYWGVIPGGSVKIGHPNDPLACLDSKFRVKGIRNLRVVDSSVAPIVPGFLPNIWLYLIGMKAAEDIISNN